MNRKNGTEASVGVNWFEGLVQRNRAALFMRQALWSCLSRYVDDLDDDVVHCNFFLRV